MFVDVYYATYVVFFFGIVRLASPHFRQLCWQSSRYFSSSSFTCGILASYGGTMKTEQEIREKLIEVLADERLGYLPASVQINAPLALVQLALEVRRDTLAWVLKEEDGG